MYIFSIYMYVCSMGFLLHSFGEMLQKDFTCYDSISCDKTSA